MTGLNAGAPHYPKKQNVLYNSPPSFPQRVMLLLVVIKGGRETEFNNLIEKITPDTDLVRKTTVFLLLLWCHIQVIVWFSTRRHWDTHK